MSNTLRDVFAVHTFHDTWVFLDDNSFLSHMPLEQLRPDAKLLYAHFDDVTLQLFTLVNGTVRYVKAIGNNGHALLADTPQNLIFTRDFVDNSVSVTQNGNIWSASLDTRRFTLSPLDRDPTHLYLDAVPEPALDKTDAVLIVFDLERLETTLARLNFERINVKAILVDGVTSDTLIVFGLDKHIPNISFNAVARMQLNKTETRKYIAGLISKYLLPLSNLEQILPDARESLWLLAGDSLDRLCTLSDRLQRLGVPRGAIVSIEPKMDLDPTWLANLKFASGTPLNFIAVGDRQTALGLDLSQLVGQRGVNLAADRQDLRQSYLIVRHVLERNPSIKVVLLGLNSDSLSRVDDDHFSTLGLEARYVFGDTEDLYDDNVMLDRLTRPIDLSTEATPDPNFVELKQTIDQNYSDDAIDDDRIYELSDLSLQRLEAFIELCKAHDVTLVGVLFPTLEHDESTALLRRILLGYEHDSAFRLLDLSELPLDAEDFSDRRHLNLRGAATVGNVLNYRLHVRGVLPFEELRLVDYERLYGLMSFLGRDEYNDMLSRIFEATSREIARKLRIKVGFVLCDASTWCGERLYRLFADNDRYEPTVFMCLRKDADGALLTEAFERDAETFEAHGFNVCRVKSNDERIPQQDILIYLTPYFHRLPTCFRPYRLTAETLIAYVSYACDVSYLLLTNFKIHFVGWRIFAATEQMMTRLIYNNMIEHSRIVCSGLPKLDRLEPSEAKFEWKEAQPGSTKIIWAPHWSITGRPYMRLSTFRSNYEFMYEYAAAHPETSWVVKPHPNLLFTAVKTGVFESTEAFEAYFRRWNELPNAKVVTSGCYQDIFATSDGLINDGASLAAEYQYTLKPLLFLTRSTTKLTRLGKAIVGANYRADGADFDAIKKFIEDVLIAGNDTQLDARRQIFESELDHQRRNGLSASDYIFRTVDAALTE